MKFTQIKLKLLKQLCRCDIYVGGQGNKNITSLQLCSVIDKMIDGIMVGKDDLTKINTFWRQLSSLLENCIDADDMRNYCVIKTPKSMDKDMFWKAYNTLKETYQIEGIINTTNDILIKKKKTLSINPVYGKHFNQFNQGQ